MSKLFILPIVATLAGCQISGVKTGPLSDPEVLNQRCAEANLALTVAIVASKDKNAQKFDDVRATLDAVCKAGVITDYPSALNAISNALLTLKK